MDVGETKVAVLPEGLHYNLSRLRRAGVLPKITRNRAGGTTHKNTAAATCYESTATHGDLAVGPQNGTLPWCVVSVYMVQEQHE